MTRLIFLSAIRQQSRIVAIPHCTLQGYEAMAMIRKGQVQSVDRGDVIGQISFIHQIFGMAA